MAASWCSLGRFCFKGTPFCGHAVWSLGSGQSPLGSFSDHTALKGVCTPGLGLPGGPCMVLELGGPSCRAWRVSCEWCLSISEPFTASQSDAVWVMGSLTHYWKHSISTAVRLVFTFLRVTGCLQCVSPMLFSCPALCTLSPLSWALSHVSTRISMVPQSGSFLFFNISYLISILVNKLFHRSGV